MSQESDQARERAAEAGTVSSEPKILTPAAQRALAEAEERRRRAEAEKLEQPTEIAGRGGLDPVRYGDWEIKGLTSDF